MVIISEFGPFPAAKQKAPSQVARGVVAAL